ncbi:hypothetical protein GCM10023075_58650 [Streptosporangium album]
MLGGERDPADEAEVRAYEEGPAADTFLFRRVEKPLPLRRIGTDDDHLVAPVEVGICKRLPDTRGAS